MKYEYIGSIQFSEFNNLLTFALVLSINELLKQIFQDFDYFGGKLFPIAL